MEGRAVEIPRFLFFFHFSFFGASYMGDEEKEQRMSRNAKYPQNSAN